MEILELTDQPSDHPYYLATQYHPEFKSRCVCVCLAAPAAATDSHALEGPASASISRIVEFQMHMM
jgi:hypothetical protein